MNGQATFTAGFLADALRPLAVYGRPGHGASGISTDTRALLPGALYVALKGENFDGHAFCGQALAAKAAGLVVSRAEGLEALLAAYPEAAAYLVPDTQTALEALAKAWRRALAPRILGITGSNGKTSTKELCAAILSTRAKTHKTAGNLNNQVGVPLSLLALRDEPFAVIEMGMNHLGEIARLAAIAQPEVGLITNVAAAHLEGLGTIENVARAKGELFDALGENATAVVNLDNPYTAALGRTVRAKTLTVSLSDAAADVRLLSLAPLEAGLGYALRLSALGETQDFTLPLLGRHNVGNLLLAVAAGLAFDVPLSLMPPAVAQVTVPGARARLARDEYPELWVIEDCYNANPASMRAALDLQREIAGRRRRVAFLGDMRELGESSDALHEELGRYAGQAGVEVLYAFGPHASLVTHGAEENAAAVLSTFASDDYETYERAVLASLLPGDVVLVKGSRGMRLERLFSGLAARFRKD